MNIIVTTAIELSSTQQNDISKKVATKLNASANEVNFVVDPSIIGGVVLQIDSQEINSSVKQKLDVIAASLYQQS